MTTTNLQLAETSSAQLLYQPLTEILKHWGTPFEHKQPTKLPNKGTNETFPMIAPSPNSPSSLSPSPHDVIVNEEEYTSIDNTQIHTKKMRLIIENPPVILPSLGFLLGSQSGNVEDDTNFFGTLAHELT